MSTRNPTNPFDTAYPSQPEMTEGMTKRELMAMHIYAGFAARYGVVMNTKGFPGAEGAVAAADALIQALKAIWTSASSSRRGLMASLRSRVWMTSCTLALRTSLAAHMGEHTACIGRTGVNGLWQ